MYRVRDTVYNQFNLNLFIRNFQMNKTQLRLSDEIISHVAKLLQLAILSGTDVVDHMRLIRVSADTDEDSLLVLSDDYREISDSRVQEMLDKVTELQEEDKELN